MNLTTHPKPFYSTSRVSIIVPMHNAAQPIATTIESILSQENCCFEVICVDGESTDRTVEIVRSYNDSRCQVELLGKASLFEMINRGIKRAKGDYIHILYPGDSYLYPEALALVMCRITQNQFPDLFYAASFLREASFDQHLFFCPLKAELLQVGIYPTFLQSCWIKKSVFENANAASAVGYFDEKFKLCAPLDFFIRLAERPGLLVASDMRVYTDIAEPAFNYAYLLCSFRENFQIIRKHFGLFSAIVWLVKQKDSKHLFSYSLRRFTQAFQSK